MGQDPGRIPGFTDNNDLWGRLKQGSQPGPNGGMPFQDEDSYALIGHGHIVASGSAPLIGVKAATTCDK